ncbi:MAG: AraC family transcriptional regulator [Spirochaetaceae bacterium]|jgi:AraC-like DNA-binding protein|nr:AraC family transcriptional regulator [Spirochaetaceae bacterium]
MAQLPLKFEQSSIWAVKSIAIRPDVHITISSGVFQEDQKHSAEAFAPVFELSYSRLGDIQGEVNRRPVEVKSGYAVLGFINHASTHSEYKAGFAIKLYSIWIEPAAFNHFCRAVRGGSAPVFSSFQKGNYRSLQFKTEAREEYILSRIESRLGGGEDRLNKLFLESQTLELLSLNLERLLGVEYSEAKSAGLSKTDTENLIRAREILLTRLESPPSLLELSRLVHMNDCKLKRVFKIYFGKTVYEYIREQRLEKAFSLLETGRCNVGQSAFAVGYTNIRHFSEAFREKFGISPKTLSYGK